ncbi:MAG: hypothetical protein KDK34_04745, partial [Leptospiraceae bacterium]|nr:hypothetical protein [Leptospiraceae bacterium]
IRPELQTGLGLGADAGGLRLEYRDQNRARLLAYPGLNLAVRHPDQPWLHAGVHASARLLQDYHYYNSNTDDADGEVRTGEAYAYFNWRTDDWWSSRTTTLWSGERQSDGIHLRVGRLAVDIDPEGLLYSGEAPTAQLMAQMSLGDATALRFGLAGRQLEREYRHRRAYESSSNHAALYSLMAGVYGTNAQLSILYSFLRFPGRTAQPDYNLPGIPPTLVTWPIGQSALPDYDVHYWGLRGGYDGNSWGVHLLGLYNYGRSYAVGADGTRELLSRQRIRGGLGYAGLLYRIGEGLAPGCESGPVARTFCSRSRSVQGAYELELAVLATTRDRSDFDSTLNGFGSIRPQPAVMGGVASILLNGPSPWPENPALQNRQPVIYFNDGGVPTDDLNPIVRDQVDPAPPDYDNQGLRMGSLRFTHIIENIWVVDAYFNYADYLTGDGSEFILTLTVTPDMPELPVRLFFAATAATYRPDEPLVYDWLRTARRDRRFYSRYLMGVTLNL